MNVLVVDDDMINRKLMVKILEKNPYITSITEAADGEEAILVLKDHEDEIDMVFLDIFMPKMDGLEMLEIMRNDEKLRDIPVIVLSTDDTKRQKSMELGAIDFMRKPINENELNKLLESNFLS